MNVIENSYIDIYLNEFEIIRELDSPIGVKIMEDNDEMIIKQNLIQFPKIQVTRDSPAEKAGLRNDQRLIAVNGKFVNKGLNKISHIIEAIYNDYFKGPSLKIIVIEPENWNHILKNSSLIESKVANIPSALDISNQDSILSSLWYDQNIIQEQLVMNHLMNTIETLELKYYTIHKHNEFAISGIVFNTEEITSYEPGQRLVFPLFEVVPESPAEFCGLISGQRVVAVNDTFINKELKSLDDVAYAVEESYETRGLVELKVIDQSTWHHFMDNPQLAVDLTTKSLI